MPVGFCNDVKAARGGKRTAWKCAEATVKLHGGDKESLIEIEQDDSGGVYIRVIEQRVTLGPHVVTEFLL